MLYWLIQSRLVDVTVSFLLPLWTLWAPIPLLKRYYYLFFGCWAYGILVPPLGIKPGPPALEAQSLNHQITGITEPQEVPTPVPYLNSGGSAGPGRHLGSSAAVALMLADAVFSHWGVFLLHCVERACRWGTAHFSQVLGEGLSDPGKCDTLPRSEPSVSNRRVTTHTYKHYLMVACCSKADWKFHGNHRNASFLPVILLIELFHLHSSVVKGRCVQAFVPTPYQALRVERLFVDGFINCLVHVFLPNLKWVRNGIH